MQRSDSYSLATVFQGWDSYQLSLVHAIAPLRPENLAWRPAPSLRSVGQTAGHISLGRVSWFRRMDAPGSAELAASAEALRSVEAIEGSATALVEWLEASWRMVEATLTAWTVADLAQTYLQPYQGKTYAVTRQWTLWRILAHDLHHGGEIAVALGMQGIPVPELGDLGGHLTEPEEVPAG